MPLYSCTLPNPESQLVAVRNSLYVLYFSMYGLNQLQLVTNHELCAFESLICDAIDSVNELLLSLRPVACDVGTKLC